MPHYRELLLVGKGERIDEGRLLISVEPVEVFRELETYVGNVVNECIAQFR